MPDVLIVGATGLVGRAVIDHFGCAARDIHAVGPITKGAFWEIIAVPDLRLACANLAKRLLDAP